MEAELLKVRWDTIVKKVLEMPIQVIKSNYPKDLVFRGIKWISKVQKKLLKNFKLFFDAPPKWTK